MSNLRSDLSVSDRKFCEYSAILETEHLLLFTTERSKHTVCGTSLNGGNKDLSRGQEVTGGVGRK